MGEEISSPVRLSGQLPLLEAPQDQGAHDLDVLCSWLAEDHGWDLGTSPRDALSDSVFDVDSHSVSRGRLPYAGSRHVAVCWA